MSLRNNKFTWPVASFETCPCGSGLTYGQCHGGGSTCWPVSTATPPVTPGALTGHAHQRCFMASTNDCCSKISKEHWLSQSVLQQLDTLSVYGLPGSRTSLKTVGIKSLASNILCRRHNSSLSPLDTCAGQAFANLKLATDHLFNPFQERKAERTFIVDGFAIELWTLKALLGGHMSGVLAADGEPSRDTLSLDIAHTVATLMSGTITPPAGFYYRAEWHLHQAASFVTLSDDEGRIVGSMTVLSGLTYVLALAKPPVAFNAGVLRPRMVRVSRGKFVSNIAFAWDDKVVGEEIVLTNLDDWEKKSR